MTMHRALQYAENDLGVHNVWTDSQNIVQGLNELYNTRAGLETSCRKLDYEIERRKEFLLTTQAQTHNDMAVTAFERHMRVIYASDDQLEALRSERLKVMSHRDVITGNIAASETNHKGHVARMVELGGYFEYLAHTKHAATVVAEQLRDLPW
jgi:hypothetical protein